MSQHELTDAEEIYITQKVESALQKLTNNPGQYLHLSKQRYSSIHRGRIYGRVKEILQLTGVPYEEPPGWARTYKIKILRREDM